MLDDKILLDSGFDSETARERERTVKRGFRCVGNTYFIEFRHVCIFAANTVSVS